MVWSRGPHVEVQETNTWNWRRGLKKKQLPRENSEARQYAPSGTLYL